MNAMMKKIACVLCLMAFAQSAVAQSMLPADKLKAFNETQQKIALKLLLNASGEVCGEVLRTMYQGGNSSFDIWSVGCTAGREYQVTMTRDAEGSNTLLTCQELAAGHAILSRGRPKGDIGCWIRYKN